MSQLAGTSPMPLRTDGRPPSPGAGLSDQVEAYLRDHIVANRLMPGDRLPSEAEISRTLGISRPIVREASKTLSALGLIEAGAGRYPRVSGLQGSVVQRFFEDAVLTGQGEARQILEVRRGIEISMAGLAAQRRGPEMAGQLGGLVDRMATCIDQPNAYVELDMAFHMALARASENPFYVVLVDGCRGAFEASMTVGLRHRFGAAELDRVQRLHVAIVEAVSAGDADRAAAAMTSHFDDALAALYRNAGSPTEEQGPTEKPGRTSDAR
jgi:DNA-binding FadR family transcriptional regulator